MHVISEKILTHAHQSQDIDLSIYREKFDKNPALTLSKEETIDLLQQLSEFELGRFLLKNRGLNGYWTAYIILHGCKKENLNPLEHWVLHSAPAVKATQERFKIFQDQLQQRLKNNMTIASIPCGLMDDLLGLNYSQYEGIRLVGIDLDEQSLELARENAHEHGIQNVEFFNRDAWCLGGMAEYDMITSNGLNIYEPDPEKVVALYQEFHSALKPNGIFMTSFLTPPPTISPESSWKNFDLKNILKQKAIFVDIIQAKWQSFNTLKQIQVQLETAGFEVLDVIEDSQGMFPTLICKKI